MHNPAVLLNQTIECTKERWKYIVDRWVYSLASGDDPVWTSVYDVAIISTQLAGQ